MKLRVSNNLVAWVSESRHPTKTRAGSPCHRSAVMLLALAVLSMPVNADTPQSATARIVGAANAFLATLDQNQRAKVLYKFDDNEQRARWSNLPTGFVPRGGLKLGDLTDAQRSAAMALVASALSERGFEKVQQIMQGDETLKTQPDNGGPGQRNGGPRGQGGGGPGPDNGGPGQDNGGPGPDNGGPGPDNGGFGQNNGGPPGGPGGGGRRGGNGGGMFGKDLYYISILGTPSEKDPWMLQFGGHHLALNITIVGEQGVLTPSLTGAQPALYQTNGKTVRPLGQESDKALALLNALDDGQKKAAILSYHVADLVLGPGHDGETIQPEGLKASAMNDKQRTMLLDVISEWVNIENDSFATARMEEITSGLDDTWFAWSGPTTAEAGKNITAYYRIQGPKLVIEYAPQRLGGDLSLHVHTMYRDPTNDYGRGLIKK
jgi:Protein of unknown function (DUF3500)